MKIRTILISLRELIHALITPTTKLKSGDQLVVNAPESSVYPDDRTQAKINLTHSVLFEIGKESDHNQWFYWLAQNLPQLTKALKELRLTAPDQTFLIESLMPHWLQLSIIAALSPQAIAIDTPNFGQITIPETAPEGEGKGLAYRIYEDAECTLVEFTSPRCLQPDQLKTIMPPAVNPDKGVIISGIAPSWISATIGLAYAKSTAWVACTKKDGAAVVVISNSEATALGTEISQHKMQRRLEEAALTRVPRRRLTDSLLSKMIGKRPGYNGGILWRSSDLPQLTKALKARNEKKFVIESDLPHWLQLSIIAALSPQAIAVDTQIFGELTIPKTAPEGAGKGMAFRVYEDEEFTLIEGSSPRHFQPEQLNTIVPPAVNPDKGVIISINAPSLIIATIGLAYTTVSWVACTKKKNGAAVVVISNSEATALGTEIDQTNMQRAHEGIALARVPKRGEIWLYDAGGHGTHPGLIISQQSNNCADSVLLVPFTTSLKHKNRHLAVESQDTGLACIGFAKCEQIISVSRAQLQGLVPIGVVTDDFLTKVVRYILRAIGAGTSSWAARECGAAGVVISNHQATATENETDEHKIQLGHEEVAFVEPQRGQIWLFDDTGYGARRGLIISPKNVNNLNYVLIVPLTTETAGDSVAMCQNISCVPKTDLRQGPIGSVTDELLAEVVRHVRLAIGDVPVRHPISNRSLGHV